mgnify:CR=1 FL=1
MPKLVLRLVEERSSRVGQLRKSSLSRGSKSASRFSIGKVGSFQGPCDTGGDGGGGGGGGGGTAGRPLRPFQPRRGVQLLGGLGSTHSQHPSNLDGGLDAPNCQWLQWGSWQHAASHASPLVSLLPPLPYSSLNPKQSVLLMAFGKLCQPHVGGTAAVAAGRSNATRA